MRKRNEKRRYSEKRNTSDHLAPIASPTPLANLSLNSVLLYDWWLCTAEPRGLAVGGFECRGRQGQRVLCSAAIAKRHDATTLETADGVTVAISGFINTSRDSQKSVFDHMLQKLSPQDSQNADITVDSNTGNKHPKVCPDSAADGQNSNCQKNDKVIEKDIDDNNMSHSRSKTTVKSENEDQSRIGVGSTTQTIGVKTRSMTRLKQERAGLR